MQTNTSDREVGGIQASKMAVPPEKEKKFEDTKKMIRSVLLGEKDGVVYHKLRGKCNIMPLAKHMIASRPILCIFRVRPDLERCTVEPRSNESQGIQVKIH